MKNELSNSLISPTELFSIPTPGLIPLEGKAREKLA
jgi:hypothetical protein